MRYLYLLWSVPVGICLAIIGSIILLCQFVWYHRLFVSAFIGLGFTIAGIILINTPYLQAGVWCFIGATLNIMFFLWSMDYDNNQE